MSKKQKKQIKYLKHLLEVARNHIMEIEFSNNKMLLENLTLKYRAQDLRKEPKTKLEVEDTVYGPFDNLDDLIEAINADDQGMSVGAPHATSIDPERVKKSIQEEFGVNTSEAFKKIADQILKNAEAAVYGIPKVHGLEDENNVKPKRTLFFNGLFGA